MTNRYPILVCLLIAVAATAAAVVVWLGIRPAATTAKTQEEEIEALINQLALPENKTKVWMHIVPGGEILDYTPPMKRLVEIGDPARERLHQRLGDVVIQNEVALVLGQIGDESTVPLLINHFPDTPIPNLPPELENTDPVRLKIICFTSALGCLTRAGIGHTRWGTEFRPGLRDEWQQWWGENYRVFWVRDDSPQPERKLKSVDQVLTQLETALQDDDPQVRRAAAGKYFYLKGEGKPSVGKLVVALKDPDDGVRRDVAHAFSDIGPEAGEAIPALIHSMRYDKSDSVRDSAQYALGRIGAEGLAPLLELIDDEDKGTRRRAIRAIGEMDPKQKSVIPTFLRLAHDPDPDIRELALSYSQIIDQEDPAVLQALLQGLDDESAHVRRSCVYYLERMGQLATAATEPLLLFTRDPDGDMRRAALSALLKIGSFTKEHVPLLITLMDDEQWEVRSYSAQSLGKIGPDASAAVGALSAGLTDKQGSVRWWSATALGSIGPAAKSALPALRKALADEEWLVRSDSAKAIRQIDPNEVIEEPRMSR